VFGRGPIWVSCELRPDGHARHAVRPDGVLHGRCGNDEFLPLSTEGSTHGGIPMTVAHSEHARPFAGEDRLARGKGVSWRVWYVAVLAGVTVSLFLFVPAGGNLALLVLFGGLMALHHIPGGGHHHGKMGGAERPAPARSRDEGEDTPHSEPGGAKVSGSNRRRKGGGGRSGHCH